MVSCELVWPIGRRDLPQLVLLTGRRYLPQLLLLTGRRHLLQSVLIIQLLSMQVKIFQEVYVWNGT